MSEVLLPKANADGPSEERDHDDTPCVDVMLGEPLYSDKDSFVDIEQEEDSLSKLIPTEFKQTEYDRRKSVSIIPKRTSRTLKAEKHTFIIRQSGLNAENSTATENIGLYISSYSLMQLFLN